MSCKSIFDYPVIVKERLTVFFLISIEASRKVPSGCVYSELGDSEEILS